MSPAIQKLVLHVHQAGGTVEHGPGHLDLKVRSNEVRVFTEDGYFTRAFRSDIPNGTTLRTIKDVRRVLEN